jgi:putative toxin-antitoxin system antitoxin component (TIGR02293 family)
LIRCHMAYKLTPYGRISGRAAQKGTKMTQTAKTGSEKGTDLLRFWEELESEGWEANHPYLLLLGLGPMDTARLVERVEEGLSFGELERLRQNMGLSMDEMAGLVQIRPRTLDRRKKEGWLRPEESDRLLRASRVFGRAIALFEGDGEGALVWLSTPQMALGGAVPLEMARTEIGAREVEGLIGRLEHGVFS